MILSLRTKLLWILRTRKMTDVMFDNQCRSFRGVECLISLLSSQSDIFSLRCFLWLDELISSWQDTFGCFKRANHSISQYQITSRVSDIFWNALWIYGGTMLWLFLQDMLKILSNLWNSYYWECCRLTSTFLTN